MKLHEKRDEGSPKRRCLVGFLPGVAWVECGQPVTAVVLVALEVIAWAYVWQLAIPFHLILWLAQADALRKHETWELYDVRKGEMVWTRESDGAGRLEKVAFRVPHTGSLSAQVHGLMCEFDGNRWRTPDAGLTAKLQAATDDSAKAGNTIQEVAAIVFYRAGVSDKAEIVLAKSDLYQMDFPV